MQSWANATGLLRYSASAAAQGSIEKSELGSPFGRPRWLIRINLPPWPRMKRIVGNAARIRLSLATCPCFTGTLKSTRIRTFLLRTSMSPTLIFVIGTLPVRCSTNQCLPIRPVSGLVALLVMLKTMDFFFFRPSLKKTDDTAAIGPIDHLLPNGQPFLPGHGGSQAMGLVHALQAFNGRDSQAVGTQWKNSFHIAETGRGVGCIVRRFHILPVRYLEQQPKIVSEPPEAVSIKLHPAPVSNPSSSIDKRHPEVPGPRREFCRLHVKWAFPLAGVSKDCRRTVPS